MSEPTVTVSPAEFPRDRTVVADLFTAYAESLGVDLSFQNFTEELSQLPGKYTTEKGGAVFLAYATSTPHAEQPSPKPIGCVAVRAFNTPNLCELKRLYIIPDARGLGAARLLMDAVMAKARELGFKEMLLDTLARMVPARKLYARYGFQEVDKYYDNPLTGTVFMKAPL